MAKYQSRATRLSNASAKIEEGLSEVEALADEMEEWQNNMEGTNLENTGKYQMVEECATALREAHSNIEGATSDLDSVEFPGMYG